MHARPEITPPMANCELRRASRHALWSKFADEQDCYLLVSILQATHALKVPYNGTCNVPSGIVEPSTSAFNSSDPVQNLTDRLFQGVCRPRLSAQLEPPGTLGEYLWVTDGRGRACLLFLSDRRK